MLTTPASLKCELYTLNVYGFTVEHGISNHTEANGGQFVRIKAQYACVVALHRNLSLAIKSEAYSFILFIISYLGNGNSSLIAGKAHRPPTSKVQCLIGIYPVRILSAIFVKIVSGH